MPPVFKEPNGSAEGGSRLQGAAPGGGEGVRSGLIPCPRLELELPAKKKKSVPPLSSVKG